MIDSRLPRFSQAVQAAALASAFALDATWVVPALGVLLAAAVLGGLRWNLFALAYRALPIPPGEPEPAAPPRFAQKLGVIFLGKEPSGSSPPMPNPRRGGYSGGDRLWRSRYSPRSPRRPPSDSGARSTCSCSG